MNSRTSLEVNRENNNALFYNYKTSDTSNTDVIFIEEDSTTSEILSSFCNENKYAFLCKFLNNNNNKNINSTSTNDDNKTKTLLITEKKLSQKFKVYIAEITEYLNLNLFLQFIEEGDFFKQASEVQKIHEFMLENNFEKNCLVIGLGGGKITDIAGYIASTYFRGVGLILIPSNLLAMVDASIGGKTGINHCKYGKNVIGTISQPNT